MDFRLQTCIPTIACASDYEDLHQNPAPGFDLFPQECFELFRAIYYLDNSEDKLLQTLDSYLNIDLEITPTIIYHFTC